MKFYWTLCGTFILLIAIYGQIVYGSECTVDAKQDAKAINNHKVDSLNLLVFVSLLILTVLTIWLFKRHRLRFVHETGLSIIYGLVIGALINYTMTTKHDVFKVEHKLYNTTLEEFEPYDVIGFEVFNVNDTNKTHVFRYGYQSKTSANDLEDKATFDPEIFFNIILPPIIFNAGYHMKRKHFFKNFGAIVTYAFAGTTLASFVTGGLMYAVCLMCQIDYMCFADCLLFGTIISATDPVTVLAIFKDLHVDVDLYALVFGESILNDAVAIVLAETIENYGGTEGSFDGMAVLKCVGEFIAMFFSSLLLGSTCGCLTALLTKFTQIRDFPLLETSLFVLMSYATFVAAEAAKQSGIVAVLFCGICQAHYTFNNLSPQSQARTKEIFELLNFLMENFVFTYIGVSIFTFQQHTFNGFFIPFAFTAIIIARATSVYPLTFLLNLGRSKCIPFNFQHMLMYSGLRGAMAFALAMRNTSTKAHQMILTTTLLIVIATVILCGGFATLVLQLLKIRVGVQDETELQNFDSVHSPGPMPPLTTARLADKALLVRMWYGIDSKFFKPLLTHVRPPLTETMPRCCLPLAKLLTTTEQLAQTRLGGVDSDDSDTDCVLNDTDDIAPPTHENLSLSTNNTALNDESGDPLTANPASSDSIVTTGQKTEQADFSLDDFTLTSDHSAHPRY